MPKLLFKTLLNVTVNPVVLPTIAGILVNIIRTYGIHHGELHPFPKWLEDFLELVSRAYVPCALFSIGLFMVGKIQKISFMSIVVSSLLVFAKRYAELKCGIIYIQEKLIIIILFVIMQLIWLFNTCMYHVCMFI